MYSWGSMPYLRVKGDGLAQGLDDREDEEVAAELDHIGHFRVGANDESALTDGIEDGLAALEDAAVSGGRDEELGGCSGFGAAEDRSGDIMLATFMRARLRIAATRRR